MKKRRDISRVKTIQDSNNSRHDSGRQIGENGIRVGIQEDNIRDSIRDSDNKEDEAGNFAVSGIPFNP